MIVAVLGAGNGGGAALAELVNKGFKVRLWNRSDETLLPFRRAGGIRYNGVLGEGLAAPELMTADLAAAIDGADVILSCLPTTAHGRIAAALAALGANAAPVVLNPGHTGGALEFVAAFKRHGVAPPPTAEFSTLTYVARKPQPGMVSITGAAKQVRVAAMPGGEAALSAAKVLYPIAKDATDVIATGLANVNMVLHPPGALLGAAWVESRRGDFTFYVQGLPDGVGRVMAALDDERLAVARCYGHDLPDLFAEMQSIGTIESGADKSAGLAAAVRSGKANSRIKAPDSLAHRYYREDFWYGIKPFLALAGIADASVPVAASLMNLAEILVGGAALPEGRSAAAMGIDGLGKDELLGLVRPQESGPASQTSGNMTS